MLADIKFGDFFKHKVLHFQNGFACGDWNDAGRGIVQLRPFNINENGEIDLAATKFIEPERDLTPYLLKENDVVFNNTNSEALVGKTALWTRDQRAVLSNHMTIVRVLSEDGISPQFVAFYLLKKWMDGYFRQVCRRHVNQASVSIERLKDTPFPDFDVDEQRRIAHVLSTLQTAIEQQARLIALTHELKRALMRKLFTEGLRGEKQKMTEIGLVPEGWEVVQLDACAVIQTGIAKGRAIADEEFLKLPYLRVANVQDGFLDLAEIKTIRIRAREGGRYLLRNGDVVLTEGGDFDKLGRGFIWQGQIENCIHQNHIFAVRVDPERLLPEFFAYQSQSPYGKRYFLSVAHKTSNLACINSAKLKRFPVLIPELDEQGQITYVLQTVDERLSKHTRRYGLLEDLFRTLLHQLMTGKVRIHELELGSLE